MTQLDFLILLTAMISIFATLIKPKTNIYVYRMLKFLVVFLSVYNFITLVNLFDQGEVLINLLLMVILLVIIYVTIKTEFLLAIRFIGIKTGILTSNTMQDDVKQEVLQVVEELADRKIGALLTFERNQSLSEYTKHAFLVGAPISAPLIKTIFTPKTPFHDGAIVIKGTMVHSAAVYFPTSENVDIPKHYGSRHRAAIGISEATDALTIIVSEETGYISVAIDGYLDYDISKESLELYLDKYMHN